MIAVVGAGYWGKNLIRNFYELKKLKYIVEIDKTKWNNYTDLDNITITDDITKVLCDQDISGIIISTQPQYHFSIAEKCLLYNKNIFIEKPLCLTLEDAYKLRKLQNNNIIMVGHILNYHPAIKQLYSMIYNKEIGDVLYIHSERKNLGKIRDQEDALMSLAPHDISVILHIAGYPSTVHAFAGCQLQPNIVDMSTIFMQFKENHIRAQIDVSWLNPTKEQKLTIIGTKGMISFNDTVEHDRKLSIYRYPDGYLSNNTSLKKVHPEYIQIQNIEPLKIECLHFIECIENNKKPNTDINEGIDVLSVLLNCEKQIYNN